MQGNIFETYIISEYIKKRFHTGKTINAYYWRDNTGHEIDLILEEGQNLYAIEIKKSQTINNEFFKNLQYYRKISSQSVDHFYLIYGGDRNQSRKNAQVIGWKHIKNLPCI